MTDHARRIGALLALAGVGYVLGGCAGDGSGVPALTGVTLPSGSLALPTLTGATETSPATTSPATTTVTEPTTTTLPETTTVIETVTTDTTPITDTLTFETETETTETVPTEPATTDTIPTDTSEEPAEDEDFWRALALLFAASDDTETEPVTVTETTEVPATTSLPPDTNPADTVAPEPASSESDTPWGWIALAAGLVVAAAIAGVVLWRRKRRENPPG